MRRLWKIVGGATVLALVALGAWMIGPPWSLASSASSDSCQMRDVLPTHGTLQLEYLHPSSAQNPDRNDYRLSGTLSWDDQAALDCFNEGKVDWAYEHSIEYGLPVQRVIWDKDLSSFGDAQPYLDTTVDSNKSHTELTVGIAKPERLRAGQNYSFSYDLMLSNNPAGGKQWIALWGQVVEKQCSFGGPWCSGLNTGTGGKNYNGDAWIGWTRGFAVTGTTCWKWHAGSDPVDCSPDQPQATPPPAPAPPTPTSAPAPSTAAPSTAAPSGLQTTDSPTLQNPQTTAPPATALPTNLPSHAPAVPATTQGTVIGCNTYGENCDGDPIYANVPAEGYDWRTEPKVTTVPNGTPLPARCYALGATTYNWAHDLGDPGPNPYDSDVYYSVQPATGIWGFIPDTYFARDKGGHLGLPTC